MKSTVTRIINNYPYSLFEAISLLRRSPALKCLNPKVSTIFSHCVPFPLPGPPMSKTKSQVINKARYELVEPQGKLRKPKKAKKKKKKKTTTNCKISYYLTQKL